MKPIFENRPGRPFLVCSLAEKTELETVCTIRNAIWAGADGFLIHTQNLDAPFHNKETLSRIFSYCEDKPVMALDYRKNPNETDDDHAAFLLESIDAGASCIDVPADLFDFQGAIGITYDEKAVDKQKALIEKAHEKGAQVLMSNHVMEFRENAVLLEMAKAQESRGADIVKLVGKADTEAEALEAMKLTTMMRDTLKTDFLHIIGGKYGRLHRVIAPAYGSCMVLCVERYCEATWQKDKPLLRAVRTVYDNLDYGIMR